VPERHRARAQRAGRLIGIHPTREGYLYLQAQTPKFRTARCELTGLHELASDPRYDDMRKRKEREDEIVPKLRAALATRTALEWEALFGESVPCAAVRSIEDMTPTFWWFARIRVIRPSSAVRERWSSACR